MHLEMEFMHQSTKQIHIVKHRLWEYQVTTKFTAEQGSERPCYQSAHMRQPLG